MQHQSYSVPLNANSICKYELRGKKVNRVKKGNKMSKPLSAKQLEAAQLLGRGVLHHETAKAINVTRQTLHRWSKRDDFQNTIAQVRNQLQAGMAQQTSSFGDRLYSLQEVAVDRIEEILKSPDTKTSDRIRAISLVGEWTSISSLFAGDLMDRKEMDEYGRTLIDLLTRTLCSHNITHIADEVREEWGIIRVKFFGAENSPSEEES
jgi:hypothetical protein